MPLIYIQDLWIVIASIACIIVLGFALQQAKKQQSVIAFAAIAVTTYYTSNVIYHHYGLGRVIIHFLIGGALTITLARYISLRKQTLQPAPNMVE